LLAVIPAAASKLACSKAAASRRTPKRFAHCHGFRVPAVARFDVEAALRRHLASYTRRHIIEA
jgi:hypothetical protein